MSTFLAECLLSTTRPMSGVLSAFLERALRVAGAPSIICRFQHIVARPFSTSAGPLPWRENQSHRLPRATCTLAACRRACARRRRRRGLSDGDCLFAMQSDLDMENNPAEAWLVVAARPRRHLRRRGGGADAPAPTCMKDAEKVRVFQNVGSAVLQLMVKGVFVDVVRFSNASRELFDRARAQIERMIEGQPVDTAALTRPREWVCPKCDLPLPSRGAVCPRCAASKGILTPRAGPDAALLDQQPAAADLAGRARVPQPGAAVPGQGPGRPRPEAPAERRVAAALRAGAADGGRAGLRHQHHHRPRQRRHRHPHRQGTARGAAGEAGQPGRGVLRPPLRRQPDEPRHVRHRLLPGVRQPGGGGLPAEPAHRGGHRRGALQHELAACAAGHAAGAAGRHRHRHPLALRLAALLPRLGQPVEDEPAPQQHAQRHPAW